MPAVNVSAVYLNHRKKRCGARQLIEAGSLAFGYKKIKQLLIKQKNVVYLK